MRGAILVLSLTTTLLADGAMVQKENLQEEGESETDGRPLQTLLFLTLVQKREHFPNRQVLTK